MSLLTLSSMTSSRVTSAREQVTMSRGVSAEQTPTSILSSGCKREKIKRNLFTDHADGEADDWLAGGDHVIAARVARAEDVMRKNCSDAVKQRTGNTGQAWKAGHSGNVPSLRSKWFEASEKPSCCDEKAARSRNWAQLRAEMHAQLLASQLKRREAAVNSASDAPPVPAPRTRHMAGALTSRSDTSRLLARPVPAARSKSCVSETRSCANEGNTVKMIGVL